MNDLTHSGIGGSSPASMTSGEIADLVGARHDSVRRTIERLADKAVITLPPLVEKPTDGRPRLEYVFSGESGKRDSYIVVAQLSPEFTAKLVDRWQALEAAPRDPMVMLNDPAAMRGILLSYTEKVLELQGEVEEMRPQVQALERIAMSDGSLCITDAAKTMQVQPKALFSFLDAHHWTYTRQGDNTRIAYQAKLQAGLLEHKTTVVTRSDGSEKTTTQVRVTPKGLARLAREFEPVAKAA
jgi:phage antirepressor YoqD-like protein